MTTQKAIQSYHTVEILFLNISATKIGPNNNYC